MGTKYDVLANRVIDMQFAIVGWRGKLAYSTVPEFLDELERMIDVALKDTDRSFPMDNEKAIELLEKGLEPVPPTKGNSRAEHITWLSESLKKREDVIKEFLILLRAKPVPEGPPAGEFTEKTRKLLGKSIVGIVECEAWVDKVVAATKEACDRLDAEVAENKELETGQLDFAKEMEKILKTKIEQIKRLEAENARQAERIKTLELALTMPEKEDE